MVDMSKEDERLLCTKWFGVFVLKQREVLDKILFEKDPKVLAKKRYRMKKGEVLDEEKTLAERHSPLKVTEDRLSEFGEKKPFDTSFIKAEDYSFGPDLLQEMLTRLGKLELRESVDHGEHLAKAVKTIQDLNETINQLMERLRDWYSIHYPELEESVDDEDFLELVSNFGGRNQIQEKTGMVQESVGGNISEIERKNYQRFAKLIRDKKEFRNELWDYVEDLMKERAPNITELTGVKLGAELIAQVGSLEEMAKLPSSTIQVLGAEKALFSHLSKGTKPPKHGLLLQHPYVHKADADKRGKIARLFANKIAIAARVDYFGSENKGLELREELEQKVKKIKG